MPTDLGHLFKHILNRVDKAYWEKSAELLHIAPHDQCDGLPPQAHYYYERGSRGPNLRRGAACILGNISTSPDHRSYWRASGSSRKRRFALDGQFFTPNSRRISPQRGHGKRYPHALASELRCLPRPGKDEHCPAQE